MGGTYNTYWATIEVNKPVMISRTYKSKKEHEKDNMWFATRTTFDFASDDMSLTIITTMQSAGMADIVSHTHVERVEGGPLTAPIIESTVGATTATGDTRVEAVTHAAEATAEADAAAAEAPAGASAKVAWPWWGSRGGKVRETLVSVLAVVEEAEEVEEPPPPPENGEDLEVQAREVVAVVVKVAAAEVWTATEAAAAAAELAAAEVVANEHAFRGRVPTTQSEKPRVSPLARCLTPMCKCLPANNIVGPRYDWLL